MLEGPGLHPECLVPNSPTKSIEAITRKAADVWAGQVRLAESPNPVGLKSRREPGARTLRKSLWVLITPEYAVLFAPGVCC